MSRCDSLPEWMAATDRVLMAEAGVGRSDLVGPDWWGLWRAGATPVEAATIALRELVDESARRRARRVEAVARRETVGRDLDTTVTDLGTLRARLRALSRRNLR